MTGTILDGALDLNLRQLRVRAAAAGIDNVKDMDREELVAALHTVAERDARKAKHDAEELAELRQACIFKGLSTDGTKEDLRLRLEQAKDGAISEMDNKIYRYGAIACGVLCIVAMGISIFHISGAIQKIMGIHIIFAVLFAIVIDGCIVCFKVIESTTKKFDIGNAEFIVRAWIVVCLVMSAALNATSFMAHAETVPMQIMAVFWACFISLVVWGTSYISMQMLTRRELKSAKVAKEDTDMASKLRKAASQYDEISKLGSLASKILGG